jgi:peptidoglycan hydrolase-like protein with peptidoglycan-binding domain
MKTHIVSVVFLAALTYGPIYGQGVATTGNAPSQTATAAPTSAAIQRQTQRVRSKPSTSHYGVPGRTKESRVRQGSGGPAKMENGIQRRTVQQGRPSTEAKPASQPAISYTDAKRRYRGERHNRAWWKSHYITIVFVGGGYYYWDAGYWCPAWGYDPAYESYDYDGPIYTYGNLLPDQVIANVQRALKELGYYAGGITGSLGSTTRAAIAAFQQDNGLDVTGAIDPETVAALGLT